ncbi:MAG: hypothetical protein VW683_00235 [Betaproteobacteria bacterium]|jgi:hypothetical protein
MSLLPLFYNQWDYWGLFNKVTFDGPNKLIYIVDEITEIDVKRDIYSAWKEWVLVGGHVNSKYPAAIRGTGGDSLGGGTFLDGYFFLINGWKLVPPKDNLTTDINITGNLYDEAGGNIFASPDPDVRLIRSTVSSRATRTITEVTASIAYPEGTIVTASLAPNQYVTASLAPNQYVTASLTSTQETMLLEVYRLLGLDPTKPLVVTPNARTVSTEISQSIDQSGDTVTVTRVP